MGALFKQTILRTTASRFRQWVRDHGVNVIGASADGAAEYHRVQYARPAVLVLGDERTGLTAEQRSLCHQLVRIPMLAGTDSLNLGVAGSLILYELAKGTSGLRETDGS
jgi:TrmH family RNA methyltransferase